MGLERNRATCGPLQGMWALQVADWTSKLASPAAFGPAAGRSEVRALRVTCSSEWGGERRAHRQSLGRSGFGDYSNGSRPSRPLAAETQAPDAGVPKTVSGRSRNGLRAGCGSHPARCARRTHETGPSARRPRDPVSRGRSATAPIAQVRPGGHPRRCIRPTGRVRQHLRATTSPVPRL
jgi:hypothetical protein